MSEPLNLHRSSSKEQMVFHLQWWVAAICALHCTWLYFLILNPPCQTRCWPDLCQTISQTSNRMWLLMNLQSGARRDAAFQRASRHQRRERHAVRVIVMGAYYSKEASSPSPSMSPLKMIPSLDNNHFQSSCPERRYTTANLQKREALRKPNQTIFCTQTHMYFCLHFEFLSSVIEPLTFV